MEAQILNSIHSTLEIEAHTLNAMRQSIGPSHVEAVKLLYACQGKLVVTGIGKSAIIGQKMVATFNSTGSKAVFMHAADAVHGDLGQIDKSDVVICLSKSGDTAELKVLLPILKAMGNTTIAMVSNASSFLANQCDLCLLLTRFSAFPVSEKNAVARITRKRVFILFSFACEHLSEEKSLC